MLKLSITCIFVVNSLSLCYNLYIIIELCKKLNEK